jgi:hypothetical protein
MSQLGVGRGKVEAKDGASLDKAVWTEHFRQAVRPAVRKKNRVAARIEQSELWPTSSAETPVEAIREEIAASPAVAEDVPFIEVKKLRDPVPRAVKSPLRPSVSLNRAPAPVAPLRNQSVPFNTIARFLNVNGAIEGMKTGGIRFDLPGRGLSQTLRLWRGSPETTTYSPAQF